MRQAVACLAFLLSMLAVSPVASASDLERAVLELVVNGTSRGDVLVYLRNGDVWVPLKDLREAGLVRLATPTASYASIPHVSLHAASPPLSFAYDENALTVSIVAPPWVLARNTIDLLPTAPSTMRYAYDPSLFMNYAPRLIDGRHLEVFGETGLSLGALRTETSAIWDSSRGGTRLMTSGTFDEREQRRTATFGDAFVSAGPLGGTLLLGGITVARNFGLDPYLVKIPRLGYTGSAMAPSTMDVYVNDVLVRRVPIQPGQFDLANVVPTAGAGVTRYVLRDAYGTEQRVEATYYASTSVLAKGLSEYACGLGLMREDMGVESFDYGRPAFISRYRLGVTDQLTSGLHLEFGGGRANAGSEATLAGEFGELEFHTAGSLTTERTARRGVAAIISHGYRRGGLSFRTLLRGATRDFATLSLGPEQDRNSIEAATTTSHSLGSRASIATEVSIAERRDAGLAARVAVMENTRLSSALSLQVRASRASTARTGFVHDAFVTLSWTLPEHHFTQLTGHVGTQGADATLRLSRSLHAPTDVGYQASWSEGDVRRAAIAARAQSSFGTVAATYTNSGGDQHTIVEAAGSAVLVGKGIYFTRATQQSFAVLEVPNVPRVRGYLNNQELGRTDSSGRVFVPGLVPNQANRLSIEQSDLPLNYVLDGDEVLLAPPTRGGAVVRFPAHAVHLVRGSVARRVGQRLVPLQYGDLTVATPERVLSSPLGAEGEFEIDGLTGGTWSGSAHSGGESCAVRMRARNTTSVVQNIGVLICEPIQTQPKAQ